MKYEIHDLCDIVSIFLIFECEMHDRCFCVHVVNGEKQYDKNGFAILNPNKRQESERFFKELKRKCQKYIISNGYYLNQFNHILNEQIRENIRLKYDDVVRKYKIYDSENAFYELRI